VQQNNIVVHISLPLLPGSLSTARSTCGKPNCACKAKPPKLHGPYYRWTGFIGPKRTTKTLTPEQARECRQRIRNYRSLEKQIRQLLRQALQSAPWKQTPPRPRP
jgi:Family of unknown function (DUF6788)